MIREENNIFAILRRETERNGITILRFSVGIIFFWFGVLKFFPDLSPAEELAGKTISAITGGILYKEISMPVLAALECIIGLSLIFKKFTEYVIPLLFFQMAGTVVPLFIFRNETWSAPFVPTLEGQYIIKNLVLIAAAIVIGAISKGGKLITDPEVAHLARKVEKKREEYQS